MLVQELAGFMHTPSCRRYSQGISATAHHAWEETVIKCQRAAFWRLSGVKPYPAHTQELLRMDG